MSVVTRGYTFGVTEQVTAAKLHALVSDATVGSILNSDLDSSLTIENSKLQAITEVNKVHGSSLYSLGGISPSAGTIPIANIDVGTTASKIVQLTSAAKLPAVDGSLVTGISGANLTGLANIPSGAGVIPSANLPAAASSFVTGMIIMWSGTIATIPSGWVLCNGSNGTPDLRDRFVIGATQDDAGAAKTNVTGSLTVTGDGTVKDHTHTLEYLAASGGTPFYYSGKYPLSQSDSANANTETWTASGYYRAGSTVGGTKNIAVYYALAFIMKT